MASITRYKDRWRAQVRRAGHPPRSKVHPTKAAAVKWARELEHKIDRGEIGPRSNTVTFGQLLDIYREQLNRATGASKGVQMTKLRNGLGDYRISELTARVIVNYATLREREGAGPVAMLHEISTLATVLRHTGPLMELDREVAVALMNVGSARQSLRHAGRVQTAKQRDRRVSQAEISDLLNWWVENPPRELPMADLALFAVATCMRLGEICSITWDDLDVSARTVWIRDRKDPRRKEGNDQLVPLLTHTTMWGLPLDPLRIIMRQPRVSPRIFPYSPNSVSTRFPHAVKGAGLIDLHFHDFRHEGISRMFESGYQIQEVALVSGHKTWELLRRYTQIDPTSLHKR